jgi:hypothetical protein
LFTCIRRIHILISEKHQRIWPVTGFQLSDVSLICGSDLFCSPPLNYSIVPSPLHTAPTPLPPLFCGWTEFRNCLLLSWHLPLCPPLGLPPLREHRCLYDWDSLSHVIGPRSLYVWTLWPHCPCIKGKPCQTSVAHACNPSYSGGRDQEDRVRRQPGQIVPETLCRKKTLTEIGLVEWLKLWVLSSNPSTTVGKTKQNIKQVRQVPGRSLSCPNAALSVGSSVPNGAQPRRALRTAGRNCGGPGAMSPKCGHAPLAQLVSR